MRQRKSYWWTSNGKTITGTLFSPTSIQEWKFVEKIPQTNRIHPMTHKVSKPPFDPWVTDDFTRNMIILISLPILYKSMVHYGR